MKLLQGFVPVVKNLLVVDAQRTTPVFEGGRRKKEREGNPPLGIAKISLSSVYNPFFRVFSPLKIVGGGPQNGFNKRSV